jgi:hypothetical protein
MDNQHRKITGYRELSESDIATMNRVKELGKAIGDFIEGFPDDTDKRWLAIGRTHMQEGLMAMTRAVAKPDFF